MSTNPSSGQFRLLYFSSASTFTKKSTEEFPAPLLVAELFKFLESKYPGINQRVLHSCAITVNEDYVDLEENTEQTNEARITIIKEGDEVAIIPPIASG